MQKRLTIFQASSLVTVLQCIFITSIFASDIRFPLDDISVGKSHEFQDEDSVILRNNEGDIERILTGHLGEDWRAVENTNVFSMAPGRVRFSGIGRGIWGRVIIVDHGELVQNRCIYSQYAHLNQRLVGPDIENSPQYISDNNQPIGLSGGLENAPHLHFEVKDYKDLDIDHGPGYTQKAPVNVNELTHTDGVTYFRPTNFIATTSSMPTYDSVVSFFGVDGNILNSGPVDGSFDFFDNFNDKSIDTAPTSFFNFPQVVKEFDGFLRFRSCDGGKTITRFGSSFKEDKAILDHTIKDGLGNSEILVAFGADVPFDNKQYYGVGLTNIGESVSEMVFLGVRKGSNSDVEIFVTNNGKEIASDPTDFPKRGFVTLKLVVNDAANMVFASYSLDNGQTFKESEDFDSFAQHGEIFNSSIELSIFLSGGVKIPNEVAYVTHSSINWMINKISLADYSQSSFQVRDSSLQLLRPVQLLFTHDNSAMYILAPNHNRVVVYDTLNETLISIC